jgi:AraC-like DNA-binding protein
VALVETNVDRNSTRAALRVERQIVRGGLAPWQETRAKQLLRENLSGDISVKDLAGACGLSVGYFNRAFRQSVGCTPHRWLTHQRLELAKQLILNTGDPLCEIALAVGFVDQSHLTRVFSQHVKASPAAWRRAQARQAVHRASACRDHRRCDVRHSTSVSPATLFRGLARRDL